MIENTLGWEKQVRQTYYFKFYPNTITLKTEKNFLKPRKLKFAIFKGDQIFSQNKLSHSISWTKQHPEVVLKKKGHLTFYLINHICSRNSEFSLKLLFSSIQDSHQEEEVVSINIEASNLIESFKTDKRNVMNCQQDFGDFILNYDLYTHSSRVLLEALVDARERENSPFCKEILEDSQSQTGSQPSSVYPSNSLSYHQFQRKSSQDGSLAQKKIKDIVTQVNRSVWPHRTEKFLEQALPLPFVNLEPQPKIKWQKSQLKEKTDERRKKSDKKSASSELEHMILFLICSVIIISFLMIPSRKV